jgi:hypothetical protein
MSIIPAPVAEEVRGADEVRGGARWLLIGFAGLTGLAVNQLVFLAGDTDCFWPWTIATGATDGFLAAAYAAGFVLSVASLRQTSWARVRVGVATVGVFTVLTLIATLVHAHRLHLSDPDPMARIAAWFWVVVYLVVPIACWWVFSARSGRRARPERRLPRWLVVVLAGQGAVLLGAGGLLFRDGLTVHEGTVPGTAWWPWPLTPLSAMVIGAWLVAFGVATVLVIREGDLGRLAVPAATYAVFGALELVSLAAHADDVTGSAAGVLGYVAVLVTIALTGGYGWRAARRAAQPAERRPVVAGSASAVPSSSGGGASTTRLFA